MISREGGRAAIGLILITAFVLLGGGPASPPRGAPAALGSTDEALMFAGWVGLWYYLSQSAWFAGLGYWTLYRPLVAGTLVGLVLGDPLAGATVGATISLAYLGFLGTGGALSADIALAGYVGAAMALVGGVSAPAAVALSFPFALAGQALFRLRLWANVFPARLAVRRGRRGEPGGVVWGNVLLPQMMLLALAGLPGAGAVFGGVRLAQAVSAQTTTWVMPALDTAGALLAALGVSGGLDILWTPRTAACYVVAALVVIAATTPAMALFAAVIGAAGALAAPWLDRRGARDGDVSRSERAGSAPPAPGPVRRRDRIAMFLTWLFFSHACYNDERRQGIGVAHAMLPILRPLHTRRETLGRALVRYLAPFNVEPNLGAAVLAVMGREEEAYAHEYAGRGSDRASRSVARPPEETGARLAGAVSGVGDAVIHGAVGTAMMALGVAAAFVDGLLGAVAYAMVMAAIVWGVTGWAFLAGYRGGVQRVLDILRGSVWRRIVVGCECAGAILFGLLTTGPVASLLLPAVLRGDAVAELATRALGALPALATVLTLLALRRRGTRESWLVAGCYVSALIVAAAAPLMR